MRDKFRIYTSDYDYGFDTFFYEVKDQFGYAGALTDLIENDDFSTIRGLDDDYELADETYFRGDLDSRFEIQIPQRHVDDLNDFIEKIETLMLEVENSYEEKIREEEQKAKDERRKMYEELKKEFEGEE